MFARARATKFENLTRNYVLESSSVASLLVRSALSAAALAAEDMFVKLSFYPRVTESQSPSQKLKLFFDDV